MAAIVQSIEQSMSSCNNIILYCLFKFDEKVICYLLLTMISCLFLFRLVLFVLLVLLSLEEIQSPSFFFFFYLPL